MRVLVTGGAGFIGSEIVGALVARGHEVRVLDDLSTGTAQNLADVQVETVVGSTQDADVVRQSLRAVDAVCHQAAKVGLGRGVADLPDYVARNDLGTAVLLAEMAASEVSHLVLASSMVVYGEGGYSCPKDGAVRPSPRTERALVAGQFEPQCPVCGCALSWREVDEDAPLDPRNGYAATKLAQEHLASAWARATDGSVIALRYHNVYGPRLPRDTPYAGVAALFRSSLLRGEPAQVYEDGGQLRDFVHVRDVARANVLALEAAGAPDDQGAGQLAAFNVASGVPVSVLDVAAQLAAAMGGPPPRVTGEFRLGDVRHIVASPRKARDQLGFRAAVTLAEGMRGLAESG